MTGASRYHVRARRSAPRRSVARAAALAALLLATFLVLSVLLEAREPTPSSSTPSIQPLPGQLLSP